jgi:hypothetical protein
MAKKKRHIALLIGVVSILVLVVLLLPLSIFAEPIGITEKNILDAISGEKAFTLSELDKLDLNLDGRVDEADLVDLYNSNSDSPNNFPKELNGYIWAISAVFTSENLNPIPVSYSFTISIDQDSAVCTSIPGFNPTKGILKQDIANPGEVPGINRPSYSLSHTIPVGTVFDVTYSEDGSIVTLTCEPITISADDEINPIGIELQRTWTIAINVSSVFSIYPNDDNHGTITEETIGFIPDSETVTSVGGIYLAPFSPNNMTPIEEP